MIEEWTVINQIAVDFLADNADEDDTIAIEAALIVGADTHTTTDTRQPEDPRGPFGTASARSTSLPKLRRRTAINTPLDAVQWRFLTAPVFLGSSFTLRPSTKSRGMVITPKEKNSKTGKRHHHHHEKDDAGDYYSQSTSLLPNMLRLLAAAAPETKKRKTSSKKKKKNFIVNYNNNYNYNYNSWLHYTHNSKRNTKTTNKIATRRKVSNEEDRLNRKRKYSARWTKDEDAILLYNRSLDPPLSFVVISKKLRERKSEACCSRYNLLKKKAAVDAAKTGMGIGTN